MDLLLILTYTGMCIAIFKIFNIPLTKWTVPTAVLGGVIIIGALIILMNYNHPYTANARQVYTSVPIMPLVRGKVIDVPVEPNRLIKAGDVLFKLDPEPFEAIVRQRQAELAAAQQQVPQLYAQLASAKATTASAKAVRDRTQQAYQRYADGRKKGGKNSPFSELEVENRQQAYLAAEAQLQVADANEMRAQLAYESTFDGVNTSVASLQSQLDKALFDLEQTVIHAPTDGYVTQVGLRKGMVAVPMPLRPVMTFIPKEEAMFVGAFWENSIKRLKSGDQAEFIVSAQPGIVFKGTVRQVMPTIAEGEFQANGNLRGAETFFKHSRALVIIDPEERFDEFHFPMGISGHVAIYTDHFHHVSVIRKVLLRMQGWVNYIFPFH
ncbi:HlyD family secretion protein [Agarivorans sp. TSD2052]|uniref:HlyD family secretion protein n=1 Tax=Agarivorans sp. TSD2052 TaxID=2937286 RepID=UPI00200C5E41|nr:HlyD family secretion protein [Agarivorans sp. TSD2052]UPW18286.1 HlyD family secretion protein [Agarivorans sp. TSD2052]